MCVPLFADCSSEPCCTGECSTDYFCQQCFAAGATCSRTHEQCCGTLICSEAGVCAECGAVGAVCVTGTCCGGLTCALDTTATPLVNRCRL
jgi:hypothetical protein